MTQQAEIAFLLFVVFLAIGVAIWWFVFRKKDDDGEEGDVCEPSVDEEVTGATSYELNEDLECTAICPTGMSMKDGECSSSWDSSYDYQGTDYSCPVSEISGNPTNVFIGKKENNICVIDKCSPGFTINSTGTGCISSSVGQSCTTIDGYTSVINDNNQCTLDECDYNTINPLPAQGVNGLYTGENCDFVRCKNGTAQLTSGTGACLTNVDTAVDDIYKIYQSQSGGTSDESTMIYTINFFNSISSANPANLDLDSIKTDYENKWNLLNNNYEDVNRQVEESNNIPLQLSWKKMKDEINNFLETNTWSSIERMINQYNFTHSSPYFDSYGQDKITNVICGGSLSDAFAVDSATECWELYDSNVQAGSYSGFTGFGHQNTIYAPTAVNFTEYKDGSKKCSFFRGLHMYNNFDSFKTLDDYDNDDITKNLCLIDNDVGQKLINIDKAGCLSSRTTDTSGNIIKEIKYNFAIDRDGLFNKIIFKIKINKECLLGFLSRCRISFELKMKKLGNYPDPIWKKNLVFEKLINSSSSDTYYVRYDFSYKFGDLPDGLPLIEIDDVSMIRCFAHEVEFEYSCKLYDRSGSNVKYWNLLLAQSDNGVFTVNPDDDRDSSINVVNTTVDAEDIVYNSINNDKKGFAAAASSTNGNFYFIDNYTASQFIYEYTPVSAVCYVQEALSINLYYNKNDNTVKFEHVDEYPEFPVCAGMTRADFRRAGTLTSYRKIHQTQDNLDERTEFGLDIPSTGPIKAMYVNDGGDKSIIITKNKYFKAQFNGLNDDVMDGFTVENLEIKEGKSINNRFGQTDTNKLKHMAVDEEEATWLFQTDKILKKGWSDKGNLDEFQHDKFESSYYFLNSDGQNKWDISASALRRDSMYYFFSQKYPVFFTKMHGKNLIQVAFLHDYFGRLQWVRF